MQQGAMSLRKPMQPGEVPAPVRFLGKLVLEVLPAALASIIGAFLFAHYQFGEPDLSRSAASAAESAPASAAMVQLVRQEHAMIRDFLTAEQAAEEKRVAAADAADADAAADANAAADAKVATAATQALLAEITEKPAEKRGKDSVIRSAATTDRSVSTTMLPSVVIASAQQDPALMPALPPPRASFVSRTLAVPGHVMAVTLHAVMGIGGIPSWIGHHVGATELDTDTPLPGAPS
jgi:hypothetical protein